jgi:pSer/pThr/pTyr-binding forkhead associated (FHA) protein
MSAKAAWWIERIAADGSALAVPVQSLPFGIGRDEDNGLVLVTSGVSRRHAILELDSSTGRLVLSDLGSTNGSYVNREKVEGAAPAR